MFWEGEDLGSGAFQQPSSPMSTSTMYSFPRRAHCLKVRTRSICSQDRQLHSCNFMQQPIIITTGTKTIIYKFVQVLLSTEISLSLVLNQTEVRGEKRYWHLQPVPVTGRIAKEQSVIPKLFMICSTIKQMLDLTNFLSFHSF